jgi:hypothetical protein
VTTAAIGLALVGVLAVRMTPGRTTNRDALVTASTAAVFPTVSADSFGDVAGAASDGGRRFTDMVGRTLSSLVSSVNRSQVSAPTISGLSAPTAAEGGELALVTPIDVDGLGVTTAAAIDGQSGAIEAMLPSGAVVAAELVGTGNGVAVVRLPEAALEDAAPLAGVAADDWTVVAYGDEFDVSGGGEDLRALTVPEAAPVFDSNGALVGLCTIGPDGVELLSVTSLPDVELPPPGPDSTDVESTVPTTEPDNGAATTVESVPTDAPVPASSSPSSTSAPGSTTPDGSVVPSSEPADSSTPDTSADVSTT